MTKLEEARAFFAGEELRCIMRPPSPMIPAR